jgi:hypothetical protein
MGRTGTGNCVLHSRFLSTAASPTAASPTAASPTALPLLSPPIHFFHIVSKTIFVMWEALLDVVSAVFHGIVSVRSET